MNINDKEPSDLKSNLDKIKAKIDDMKKHYENIEHNLEMLDLNEFKKTFKNYTHDIDNLIKKFNEKLDKLRD